MTHKPPVKTRGRGRGETETPQRDATTPWPTRPPEAQSTAANKRHYLRRTKDASAAKRFAPRAPVVDPARAEGGSFGASRRRPRRPNSTRSLDSVPANRRVPPARRRNRRPCGEWGRAGSPRGVAPPVIFGRRCRRNAADAWVAINRPEFGRFEPRGEVLPSWAAAAEPASACQVARGHSHLDRGQTLWQGVVQGTTGRAPRG